MLQKILMTLFLIFLFRVYFKRLLNGYINFQLPSVYCKIYSQLLKNLGAFHVKSATKFFMTKNLEKIIDGRICYKEMKNY